jgi:hypothetical protein
MLCPTADERSHRENLMSRSTCELAVVAFALVFFAPVAGAATAQRTFVASYGLTTNTAFNCSIAKPCRAFDDALSVTSDKGEVIVLDSAGYGPVTISKSVSITAPTGVYAGISVVSSGGSGITIAGSDIEVTLRGLTINGLGGWYGIVFSNGRRLIVERCTVTNMGFSGISLATPSASDVTLSNVRIEAAFNTGVYVGDWVRATISDSQISYSGYGVRVQPSTGPAEAHVERTVIDHGGGYGLWVDAATAPARGNITGSQIVRNFIGVRGESGALVYASDNRIMYSTAAGVEDGGGSPGIVLSNNVISANGGGGVQQFSIGATFTMKNNTVRDNSGGNIIGGALTSLTFD